MVNQSTEDGDHKPPWSSEAAHMGTNLASDARQRCECRLCNPSVVPGPKAWVATIPPGLAGC